MKRETADYLAKALENLNDARQIIQINLPKVAARCAYFVAFHAAEALIFERTGHVAKTHRGVRTEFARLAKDMPDIPRSMTKFMADGYRYKEIGDYSVSPDETVTMEDAKDAIFSAEVFLDRIVFVLGRSPPL